IHLQLDVACLPDKRQQCHVETGGYHAGRQRGRGPHIRGCGRRTARDIDRLVRHLDGNRRQVGDGTVLGGHHTDVALLAERFDKQGGATEPGGAAGCRIEDGYACRCCTGNITAGIVQGRPDLL
ncbi:hypothetical protein OD305_005501, partial [Salmonella enterica]|nr:hypothetical protein [Salmonella enterica]EJX3113168.1 hypothetical protein [Salmonella enterica]EJX3604642.1 hypothetical protein [Salmonella enterica]